MSKHTPPVALRLHEFADKVGCHFTTASRLRSGDRMPGREMFDRIVKAYDLDPLEALTAFCGSRDGFGAYLRANVFDVTEEDVKADKERNAPR